MLTLSVSVRNISYYFISQFQNLRRKTVRGTNSISILSSAYPPKRSNQINQTDFQILLCTYIRAYFHTLIEYESQSDFSYSYSGEEMQILTSGWNNYIWKSNKVNYPISASPLYFEYQNILILIIYKIKERCQGLELDHIKIPRNHPCQIIIKIP